MENRNLLKNQPETLSISTTAGVLGFSRAKVRRLIKSGYLRSHKIGGRHYLLRDEILEDIKR